MYWKKTHPQKNNAHGADSHGAEAAAGRAALDGNPRHTGQFHFDLDVAKRIFDGRDRQRAGKLEIPLLLKLAEEIWASLQPNAQKLSQPSKEVILQKQKLTSTCGTHFKSLEQISRNTI